MGNRCMGIQTLNPYHFRHAKQVCGYTCRHARTCTGHSSSIYVLVNQVSPHRVRSMQSWVGPGMRSCFGSLPVFTHPTDMRAMQSR